MKKNVLPGISVAAFAVLTFVLGDLLGLDLDQIALMGVALGAVIGLVPDRSNAERIAAFLAGFLVAWIGYAIRASLLPDTLSGRAVAAVIVLVVVMGIAALSGSRLPLWAGLVGVAAMVASYEPTYLESPAEFVNQSPTAATTVLLAAAMGHLSTIFLGPQIEQNREAERHGARRAGRSDENQNDVEGVEL